MSQKQLEVWLYLQFRFEQFVVGVHVAACADCGCCVLKWRVAVRVRRASNEKLAAVGFPCCWHKMLQEPVMKDYNMKGKNKHISRVIYRNLFREICYPRVTYRRSLTILIVCVRFVYCNK